MTTLKDLIRKQDIISYRGEVVAYIVSRRELEPFLFFRERHEWLSPYPTAAYYAFKGRFAAWFETRKDAMEWARELRDPHTVSEMLTRLENDLQIGRNHTAAAPPTKPTGIRRAKQSDMTAENFRKALKEIGMTQTEFAALSGYTDRTIRRYASGDVPIPKIVEIILNEPIPPGAHNENNATRLAYITSRQRLSARRAV